MEVQTYISPLPAMWLIACAAGVLLLRVGLGVYATGMVQAKNAASVTLRGVADVCLGVLAVWLVGLVILHPGGWRAGAPRFFEMCAVLIGGGVVVGALAERSRFYASLVISPVLMGLVIPLCGRWAWSGWLGQAGYRDAAGAGVIHFTAAVCALAGTMMVGPRSGKFHRDGSTGAIPGHSTPMASLGALLMLVGWVGYLGGFAEPAAASGAVMNALLSAAAGGATALLIAAVRGRKPDVHLVHAALLGALVAVSACAPWIDGIAAVIIGTTAGALLPWLTGLMDYPFKIDDPTGAITIHGGGAVWGLLACGLFAPAVSLRERVGHVGAQMLGLLVMGAVAGVCAAAVWGALRAMGRLRSREADEMDGLDLAEHDAGGYPDFHQSMIKSY